MIKAPKVYGIILLLASLGLIAAGVVEYHMSHAHPELFSEPGFSSIRFAVLGGLLGIVGAVGWLRRL